MSTTPALRPLVAGERPGMLFIPEPEILLNASHPDELNTRGESRTTSRARTRYQMAVGQIAVDRHEAAVSGDALARIPCRMEMTETGAPGIGIVNLDDDDRA